jgi:glycosyltransferase 2 family protein
MKNARPTLVFLGKVLISLGLLGYFFTRIDLDQFLHALASAQFSLIAVAIVAYLLGQLISAVRWTAVARPLGFQTRFKDFVAYYFIGMFFNLFAPSTVGGDVSRVYYLARDGQKSEEKGWTITTVHSLISVLADRAIGMVVLLWLGATALVVFPIYPIPSLLRKFTIALALAFVLAWLMLPLLRPLLPEHGQGIASKLRLALRSYRIHWKVIPLAMFLSLLVHLIQSWMHVLLGQALHVAIPWSYCLIVYPLVGTFTALPVSLNGIGLREFGYLFLLGLIGMSSEKAIAFGLLWFMIVAIDSLLGGLVFVLKRSPRPSAIASGLEV